MSRPVVIKSADGCEVRVPASAVKRMVVLDMKEGDFPDLDDDDDVSSSEMMTKVDGLVKTLAQALDTPEAAARLGPRAKSIVDALSSMTLVPAPTKAPSTKTSTPAIAAPTSVPDKSEEPHQSPVTRSIHHAAPGPIRTPVSSVHPLPDPESDMDGIGADATYSDCLKAGIGGGAYPDCPPSEFDVVGIRERHSDLSEWVSCPHPAWCGCDGGARRAEEKKTDTSASSAPLAPMRAEYSGDVVVVANPGASSATMSLAAIAAAGTPRQQCPRRTSLGDLCGSLRGPRCKGSSCEASPASCEAPREVHCDDTPSVAEKPKEDEPKVDDDGEQDKEKTKAEDAAPATATADGQVDATSVLQ